MVVQLYSMNSSSISTILAPCRYGSFGQSSNPKILMPIRRLHCACGHIHPRWRVLDISWTEPQKGRDKSINLLSSTPFAFNVVFRMQNSIWPGLVHTFNLQFKKCQGDAICTALHMAYFKLLSTGPEIFMYHIFWDYTSLRNMSRTTQNMHHEEQSQIYIEQSSDTPPKSMIPNHGSILRYSQTHTASFQLFGNSESSKVHFGYSDCTKITTTRAQCIRQYKEGKQFQHE